MTASPCAWRSALAVRLGGVRALLADDDPVAASVYEAILSQEGANVTWARDGYEARQAYCASRDEGRLFDLAVLDHSMPGYDGTMLTALLRAEGFQGAIVGLTAGVDASQAREWLGCGCEVVLPKSAAAPLIRTRIRHLIRRMRAASNGERR